MPNDFFIFTRPKCAAALSFVRHIANQQPQVEVRATNKKKKSEPREEDNQPAGSTHVEGGSFASEGKGAVETRVAAKEESSRAKAAAAAVQGLRDVTYLLAGSNE